LLPSTTSSANSVCIFSSYLTLCSFLNVLGRCSRCWS
jgi:hypothetical protein